MVYVGGPLVVAFDSPRCDEGGYLDKLVMQARFEPHKTVKMHRSMGKFRAIQQRPPRPALGNAALRDGVINFLTFGSQIWIYK